MFEPAGEKTRAGPRTLFLWISGARARGYSRFSRSELDLELLLVAQGPEVQACLLFLAALGRRRVSFFCPIASAFTFDLSPGFDLWLLVVQVHLHRLWPLGVSVRLRLMLRQWLEGTQCSLYAYLDKILSCFGRSSKGGASSFICDRNFGKAETS